MRELCGDAVFVEVSSIHRAHERIMYCVRISISKCVDENVFAYLTSVLNLDFSSRAVNQKHTGTHEHFKNQNSTPRRSTTKSCPHLANTFKVSISVSVFLVTVNTSLWRLTQYQQFH